MPLPSRKPGESWDAFIARAKEEIESAPERNLSPNAPLVDLASNQGSRDQGIKGLVSSKPDQGVFDSTDEQQSTNCRQLSRTGWPDYPQLTVATEPEANTTEPLYRRVGGESPSPLASNHSPSADNSSISDADKVFLDRYGDIIGVVNGHPLCVKAVGTWGEVWPQGLTNAMKALGVAPVIEAMRYTANYKAAQSRDKFFWKQIKNLKEGKPLGYRG